MVKMKDVNAESAKELTDALNALDISVPLRTQGRTKYHTERWCICRLLATLAARGQLRYPIALHHRDKPDFEFKCGASTIGVEITEAIPQNLAAADALSERESPNALLEICHFKAGAKKKTAEELRGIVTQEKLTGSGWAGDEPEEEEWAQAIQEKCWEKTRKLCAPSFFKYPENWLVIYDNLSLPMELQKSVDYLIKNLSDYWEQSTIYDALLIESECEIIKLDARSRVAWTIEDLWGPA